MRLAAGRSADACAGASASAGADASVGAGAPGAGAGAADGEELAAQVVGLLGARNLTAGTAESLTGGLIAATITSVPGASAVFAGGIVAYTADLKASLLGVPAALLDEVGTVHPEVALAMARGARRRLGVSLAVAVTGVAGPDPVGALQPGTVEVAVSWPAGDRHSAMRLAGNRAQIRAATVSGALRLLLAVLSEDNL